MKIAICSSFIPFINGGARNIVDWLKCILEEYGHRVEVIYLPQADSPELLFQQMFAYRWIDVDSADLLICLRPQAHLIPHENKKLWFIHHIRAFYDLWDSPYRGFPDDFNHKGIRDALISIDTKALNESKKIFTNSKIVSNRLKEYNKINSEVLYPPLINPERFFCKSFNNEIVNVCRMEHHKRQHLLIEAMKYTISPIKLRLCGVSSNQQYYNDLLGIVKTNNLEDKVILENRWISDLEKVELLSTCFAAAYLPLDEDSYGYPSLEAAHSIKPVLTTSDSGGVLELIEDGISGYVTEPDPKALGEKINELFINKNKTMRMGENALNKITSLNISWDHVVNRLLT